MSKDYKLDNPELLRVMLDDTNHVPDIYKPTNYWNIYAKKLIPELKEFGLRDFRRRQGSVLSSFCATDLVKKYTVNFLKSSVFNNNKFINIKY